MQARKHIANIVKTKPGNVIFSRHALEEMDKDSLTTVDVMNILKSPDAKILRDGEFENNSWRYRLETKMICLVIAINSREHFVVVTAWRK